MIKKIAVIFCLLSLCAYVHAKNSICPLGKEPYAIVAPTDEWICTLEKEKSLCPRAIIGNSKFLPRVHFTFEGPVVGIINKPAEVFSYFKDSFLKDRATKSNTIFTNVCLSEHDVKNKTYKIEGNFLDSQWYGCFEIFVMNINDYACYFMFIKISPDVTDESLRESLYRKTIGLITPLVSSKG
jgi:hypothetical protein